MTDVRLTATNPEDSSVVPVACNAKGELKLEEVPTFDGNVDGDLTVSGSATFASNIKATRFDIPAGTWSSSGSNNGIYLGGSQLNGTWYDLSAFNPNDSSVPWGIKPDGKATFAGDVAVGGNPISGAETGAIVRSVGTFTAARPASTNPVWAGFTTGNSNPTSVINASGSATFAGDVIINENPTDNSYTQVGIRAADYGALLVRGNNVNVFVGYQYGVVGATSIINSDGSCTFAGNKAGFTAEGYLWCTTRRGDTVILDFTSNGMATWAPYTPTRIRDLWSEKDVIRPVPEESSQDEPETPQ